MGAKDLKTLKEGKELKTLNEGTVAVWLAQSKTLNEGKELRKKMNFREIMDGLTMSI